MRQALKPLVFEIGYVKITHIEPAIEVLNRPFLKSVSIIGADVLYVQRFNWFTHTYEDWMKMQKRRPISMNQVEGVQRQLTLARAVCPMADSNERVQYKKRHSDNVSVLGTTEDFLVVGNLTIAQGRFLSSSEVEGGRPVCVLGSPVATSLFPRES